MSEYIQGCSDGGCILRIGTVGLHANGRCRCLRDVPTELRLKVMRKLAHERAKLAAAEADAARYRFVKRQYVQTHSPHMNGTVGFRFSHGWPALSGHSFDEAVDFAIMVVDEAAKGGRDE